MNKKFEFSTSKIDIVKLSGKDIITDRTESNTSGGYREPDELEEIPD